MAVVAVLVTVVAFLTGFAFVCWYVLRILFRAIRGWCIFSQSVVPPASHAPRTSTVQLASSLTVSPPSAPSVNGAKTAPHSYTARGTSSDSARALRTLLKSVRAPHDVKRALFKEVIASIEAGKSDVREGVVIQHLAGTGWAWPECDDWEHEFKKRGQWPYTWRSLGLDEEIPVKPASVDDAMKELTATEMTDWLWTYAPGLTPRPKKPEEVEQACRTYLTWEQIRREALARYQKSLLNFRKSQDEGRCRLLAHTLGMTICTHRSCVDMQTVSVWLFQTRPGSEDDPIERDFAERFNRGELQDQLPPFFPGDRCGLVHHHNG